MTGSESSGRFDPAAVHEVLPSLPLERVIRIDVGLEGDWSGSVVPVWTAADGLLGFERVTRSHAAHRPALEIYYEGAWVGVHCFRREAGLNVFDEALARRLVAWVEAG